MGSFFYKRIFVAHYATEIYMKQVSIIIFIFFNFFALCMERPTYIRYVITKLSKFVQISMQTSLDSFLQRILQKGPETSFQAMFSHNFLIKSFLLQYYMNWPNFITILCLLNKLLS